LAGSQTGVQQSTGDGVTDIVSVALQLASTDSLSIVFFVSNAQM